MKEEIIKTIKTKKGAKVSLVKPDVGLPFFRYHAGSNAIKDSFRYVIRQFGLQDTATVDVQVHPPEIPDSDPTKFNEMLDYFLETCVKNFMDGTTGTMALTNLFGIDEGDPLNDDWLKMVFDTFEKVFDPDLEVKNNRFVFENHVGDYTYNGKGGWEFSENESKNIRIYFPSTSEMKDNDARLTIDGYQHVEVKIGQPKTEVKTEQPKTEVNTLFLPQSFKADFYIGEEHYYGASLNGKESKIPTKYHQNGIPISLDLRLYINPYTILLEVTTDITKTNGMDTSINFQIKDGDCKLGVEARIKLAHDDFDNLEVTDVKIPTGNLIVNDLTFTNLGSFFEAAKDDKVTQAELDAFVDIDVLMKGGKIGDIWFILENEDIEMEIDGARLNISDRFIKFFDDYYNNTKEDGMPRNDAFFYKGSANYRVREEAAGSLKEAQKKAVERIIEGLNKRFFRKPLDNPRRTEAIKEFFTDQGATEAGTEEGKL